MTSDGVPEPQRGRAEPEIDPGSADSPWIESREGMLFFLNAVLVAPELMVLFPLAVRSLLSALGRPDRPSPILDTIPAVAAHVLPWVGWLLVVPLATAAWNLRVATRAVPRLALAGFLLVHLLFLAYTVRVWMSG